MNRRKNKIGPTTRPGSVRAAVGAALRLLWSVLVTTAVLGGVAVALIWWAGWPLPHRWPSADQWTAFAEQPLTSATLKAAVAVAGWLLWLVLVSSVLLELRIRLAPRSPRLRLRVPQPLRVLAAGMLGTSALTLATPAHAAAPQSPAPPVTPEHPHTPQDLHHRHLDRMDTHASVHIRHSVHLPGGWIVWPVAVGILAAAAATLLRRQAIPPASAVLRAIRAARHPAIDPTADEPPAAAPDQHSDLAELEADAAATAPLTVGLQGTTGIGLDGLPRGGVGLTGPGQLDALRGILVAAAAAATTGTTIVIARPLLRALVGDTDLPGLVATADLLAALHTLQVEISHRYLAGGQPAAAPDSQSHRPLLLITETPANPARLSALAELGADLHIRVIVAGHWRAGTTWSVDQHGYATHQRVPIGRLNTLNTDALNQIGQTLQTASHRQTPPPKPPAAPTTLPQLALAILGRPAVSTPADPTAQIRRSGSQQIAVYLVRWP